MKVCEIDFTIYFNASNKDKLQQFFGVIVLCPLALIQCK